MNTFYLLFILLLSIAFVVWTTAYKQLHPVFALLSAAIGVGLLSELPLDSLTTILKKGFGSTMEKVGLLIILGTAMGVILEKSGATIAMANAILKWVHERNAPLAISLAGFVVGLPIFCDSGFIILSGLNHSLVNKTRFTMPVMAGALATSLYAVHCLVPPHPGITAAVGTLGADLGLVMIWGSVLAIPCAAVGYFWNVFLEKKSSDVVTPEMAGNIEDDAKSLPNTALSFITIIFPIFLIATKSVVLMNSLWIHDTSWYLRLIKFVGDPIIALGAGTLLSLSLISKRHVPSLKEWLTKSVERAGAILAIIAAGGVFGEMLHATGVGKQLSDLLKDFSVVIVLPFLITSIIKTAQGSSTVAAITASSLLAPLLSDLGITSQVQLTLMLLSVGAGSMMVSHTSDAYFWVISRFSELSTRQTLRIYSTASILMGLTSQAIITVTWFLIAY